MPDAPVVMQGNPLIRGAKRAFDVVAGAAFLVVAAPVMAGVAVAVAVTSPGPILFRQTRVSKDGELFRCIKFRTMVNDADKHLDELLALDEDLASEFREGHKLREDPRTTRIGRVLRVWSLDELPQLVNVVRGEMSLIGPRPVVPEELDEHYGRRGAQLVTVRPGLSGPWQVSGRNNLSYHERVEIDIAYTVSWTFTGDLRLLARTISILARPMSNGAS